MAGAVIAENPVETMMRAGRVALGMNVRFARSGDIAQAALGCGIAPLMRRSCDDPDPSLLPRCHL